MPVQVQGTGRGLISLAGLGRPSLIAAVAFAVVALGAGIGAAVSRRDDLTDLSRRALTAAACFVGMAAVALVTALFARDFSLGYVAAYSSRSLARPYTLSALWGGMEGSLLFWTLLLTSFSAVAVRRAAHQAPALVGWATAVLAGVAVFFCALLVGPANPFVTLSPVPADGSGLNPLLQSPGMVIHPPLLYTGFVGFSIPFAFGMAALLARRVDGWWFAQTRRWTLFSWGALSIGIVLGGAWAYTELGWGGYWAWDPVENASFMPWLTATAYLHSVVIQEKRRMFKAWNLSLILMTYVLAIFGTFLTRSGILSSIHTFTEGPIGKWFLPFLALMLVGGVALLVTRAQDMRAENRLDSMLSRESAFLANNVLFLAASFAVLWGTIYPIVAELISGSRVAVGPPFFNSVFIPIGLALLALTGIGPLISWRKMSPRSLTRVSRGPLLAAALVALVLGVLRIGNLGVVIALAIAAFTSTAILAEFVRGSRLHRRREGLGWMAALGRTVARNRRRYGGYIVHLGVVLIVIGFAGAAFRTERAQHLERGAQMEVGDYTLTYERLENLDSAEKETYRAWVGVERGGDSLGRIYPERNLHLAQNQWQSEVAIRTNPVEDLYVVVTALDPDGDASIRAFVNPLTWWIWMGAAVMLAGILVLFVGGTPRPAPARARARAPEPAVATR